MCRPFLFCFCKLKSWGSKLCAGPFFKNLGILLKRGASGQCFSGQRNFFIGAMTKKRHHMWKRANWEAIDGDGLMQC